MFQASTLRDTAAPHPDLHIADSIFFLIGDSALPNQKEWDGIADAILATKYDIELSATGIKSKGSEPAADKK